jgi:CDP-paratose 2-epimerase
MKKILVTGSAGLIGSESVRQFCEKGYEVHGIDNNQRGEFFGKDGDTSGTNKKLLEKYKNYIHHKVDIRDKVALEQIFKENNFELIIHTAAQPSHDWSGKFPVIDFEINAFATVLLLEMMRLYAPKSVFIFTSSSKVYGDSVNYLKYDESKTRYDLPKNHKWYNGVPENMSLDHTMHSPYGAGKAAADLMTQEFGVYYGLKTITFRCNCLTGPAHAGARLHGFLSYLVKCIVHGDQYVINGYKGKQVRDNIHSYDLVNAFYHAYKNPKAGVVYNLGGGRGNSVSILEAITMIEEISGKKANFVINPEPRRGDHIWYISDDSKFIKDNPDWKIKYDIKTILTEMCEAYK